MSEVGPSSSVPAGGEHQLVLTEGHAFHEVGAFASGSRTLGAGLGHRLEEGAGVGEASVRETHVATDLVQLHAQAHGVAQRAVGVGEGVEEVGVRAFGAAGADLAVAAEDVHLLHRFVHEPVPEG